MEKQPKSKNNILKFLPKAASAVYFHNPPFSPNRDRRSDNNYCHRLKAHVGKGFSGPFVSMIPDEVRRKPKNGSFETQEPTSPKVSCIGQIKHKKKMVNKTKRTSPPKEIKAVSSPRDVKKHASKFKRLFSISAKPTAGRRSDASIYDRPPLSDRAPSLGQMKRFASGRDTFSNFDWTAQITPVESDHRDYSSDEDDRMYCHQGEEDEVIIPFSAPMLIGSGAALQPRKEVNLWKRRTMNPPKPLQLNLGVRTT
ncbi:hypothetical protein JCGZ_08163 [Jatropha curcas]|uniref:Syringolide-induced protein 14-1-1 n=1 Tax=Jatropha curcas TaxID=180498 RepID=A0A067KL66_JATCU|nr:uncharacterized protein At1g76070 [Jatropha curcas]KDP36872.1 hypothetical protein JCGZ_08163 [Jatropha curcas]